MERKMGGRGSTTRFERANEDGSVTLVPGRMELFRNHDESGNPLARPNTLLIDSEQLESGEALDDSFRSMAADEIERFRREIIERGGDRILADNISDADLLREVMNTVGEQVIHVFFHLSFTCA